MYQKVCAAAAHARHILSIPLIVRFFMRLQNNIFQKCTIYNVAAL